MKELEKCFNNYIDFVYRNLKVQELRIEASTSKDKFIFSPLFFKSFEIRQRVGQLTEGKEFSELVKNTESTFAEFKEMFDVIQLSYDSYSNILGEFIKPCRYGVANFFCRSGLYEKVIDKVNLNIKDLFNLFCEAFQKKETDIKYLAPLQWVEYDGPNMNFGKFQIRKFTETELEEIFNNEVNKDFYPEAYFDNDILLEYWFIVAKSCDTLKEQIHEVTQFPRKDSVSPKYTAFPQSLEDALRSILLYDWRYDNPEETTHEEDKFKIPVVLKIKDNLLCFPEKNRLLIELYAPIPKGASGFLPFLGFDKEETKTFRKFIEENERLIDNLGPYSSELEYLNIAFGFMQKGFFSKGLESLGFNIIALEALLGEKRKEVTETLKRRLSVILGDTEDERKDIRNKFQVLYDYRCTLLHGGKFKKPVYEDHLREARDLIRKTILWYINCLNYFKNKSKHLPNRSEIFVLIDQEKESLPKVKELLKSLPKNFPNIKGWTNRNYKLP